MIRYDQICRKPGQELDQILINETGSEPKRIKLAIPFWVELQCLCYHNTFVSVIVHNTFATIPLSTTPYTGVPSFKQWKITGKHLNNKRKYEEATTLHMKMHGINDAMGGRLQSNMQSC